jgi:hypothetical protein
MKIAGVIDGYAEPFVVTTPAMIARINQGIAARGQYRHKRNIATAAKTVPRR